MICLSDLSPLMQRAIARGITFMVSKSGIPGHYNLHFAKWVNGNKSIQLSYHQEKQIIYQGADGSHPMIEFEDINSVLQYIDEEFILS